VRGERLNRWALERSDPNFTPKTFEVPGGSIKHVSESCWITECFSCSHLHEGKRQARKPLSSRAEAEDWFRQHLAPDSPHWQWRYPNESVKARRARSDAESQLFQKIFGL